MRPIYTKSHTISFKKFFHTLSLKIKIYFAYKYVARAIKCAASYNEHEVVTELSANTEIGKAIINLLELQHFSVSTNICAEICISWTEDHI